MLREKHTNIAITHISTIVYVSKFMSRNYFFVALSGCTLIEHELLEKPPLHLYPHLCIKHIGFE